MKRELSVDEEIENIETIISYFESAISELKENPYFSYKIASVEEDIQELTERLEELENIQSREWEQELRHQEHGYWTSVL